MVHGQCLVVGVGGFLLGGGFNMVGTTAKYGTGAANVIEYKMVTATGDIIQVRKDNVTRVNPHGREEVSFICVINLVSDYCIYFS